MRILLAESSRIGRAMISQMLEGAGHEIIGCDTAELALAKLAGDEDIDLLLTSIEFPGMSGLELCWSARLVAGTGRSLAIIVMSASSDEKKLEEALDAGADDFITKPPRKTELLARLRSASRSLIAQRSLIFLASYDSLTGLRNRRAFFDLLHEAEPKEGPASVIILDVDYFKQVNDRHGHDGGDIVLKEAAHRLSKLDKRFARIGGEEFALLVHGNIATAGEIAEAARREIGVLPVKLPGLELHVTISLGVAERQPGIPFDQVMKDADIALYASKSGGRNRVTLAQLSGVNASFAPVGQRAA
jgi:diguanylate cyclase (GGDEF)-like protein